MQVRMRSAFDAIVLDETQKREKVVIPFRVYNREEKSIWLILNYQPQNDQYLIAKETDDEKDGELSLIDSKDLKGLNLVDFLDDEDEM